jgi:CubicO group peptidase (beta-lactamase class C family)
MLVSYFINAFSLKFRAMKLSASIILLLTLWISIMPLFSLETSAQSLSPDKTSQLNKLLSTYHDQNRFNGVVLVSKNGRKIVSKGYGSASLEMNIPNSPDKKYMLASVSKTFTAALVMKIIDQGKLRPDTKLADILP